MAIILGFTTKVGHGSGATSGPGQNLVEWLGLTEKHQAIVPIGPPKFLFFLVKSVKSKFCVVKCDELSQDFLVSTVQYLFFFCRFRNPDECVATSREHRGAVLRELALQHLYLQQWGTPKLHSERGRIRMFHFSKPITTLFLKWGLFYCAKLRPDHLFFQRFAAEIG